MSPSPRPGDGVLGKLRVPMPLNDSWAPLGTEVFSYHDIDRVPWGLPSNPWRCPFGWLQGNVMSMLLTHRDSSWSGEGQGVLTGFLYLKQVSASGGRKSQLFSMPWFCLLVLGVRL